MFLRPIRIVGRFLRLRVSRSKSATRQILALIWVVRGRRVRVVVVLALVRFLLLVLVLVVRLLRRLLLPQSVASLAVSGRRILGRLAVLPVRRRRIVVLRRRLLIVGRRVRGFLLRGR
jgi:hypothetical protein